MNEVLLIVDVNDAGQFRDFHFQNSITGKIVQKEQAVIQGFAVRDGNAWRLSYLLDLYVAAAKLQGIPGVSGRN